MHNIAMINADSFIVKTSKQNPLQSRTHSKHCTRRASHSLPLEFESLPADERRVELVMVMLRFPVTRLLEVVRNHERNVEALLEIEARVAERLGRVADVSDPLTLAQGSAHLVAKAKFLLGELHAPANALGDGEALVVELAGELKRDAIQARADTRVDAHRGHDLGHDGSKVARLVPRRGGECAARA
jgi:hypothetical protein